jgi:hypothetical protein
MKGSRKPQRFPPHRMAEKGVVKEESKSGMRSEGRMGKRRGRGGKRR